MDKENYGIRNTATIDINKYNELLKKEEMLDYKFEMDGTIIKVVDGNHFKPSNYIVLSDDDAVHELGEIYNKLVDRTINEDIYDNLNKRHLSLEKELNNLEEDKKVLYNKIDGLENENTRLNNILTDLKNSTVKQFKRWRYIFGK